MKALVKTKPEPGLERIDVERPVIGPAEVLIRVGKAAICGTDLHIYNWDSWAAKTVPTPMTIGHEFVGTVEAIGDAVTTVSIGARVSGEGHIVCGTCRNCRAGRRHLCRDTKGVGIQRPGAFAEYLSLPERNVCPIPDDISDDMAAILDPLGNAVHTALSFDCVGEDILITGAGPIGLMAAAICRHAGARNIVVTDPNEERLALAEQMGATRGVTAGLEAIRSTMADLGMKEGFDVGLEMSGAGPALTDMVETMNHGGQIGLLGIFSKPVQIDLNRAIFKSLHIKGVYGREMFDTWHKAIAMLQSGLNVAPVISEILPVARYQEGFQALNNGRACKIILDMAA